MKNRISKQVVALTLTAACVMQLCGCGISDKTKAQIASNDLYPFEVSNHDSAVVKTEPSKDVAWVPLDRLKTYEDTGFRTNFEKIFNVNIVNNAEGASKQGSMYVINRSGKDVQNGNTTMRDAFRNETFDKKWGVSEVQTDIANIIDTAYTDITKADKNFPYAALNAYFNIMSDKNNDQTFESNTSLTREQFYTALYKATNPVSELEFKGKEDMFVKEVGVENCYSPFVKQYADDGFLTVKNGGLRAEVLDKEITKYEALYLMVNLFFHDKLEAVEIDKKAEVCGVKNNPKLLKKLGIYDKDDNIVVENWQPNVMLYTLGNLDKGMCPEMIGVVGIGVSKGLLNGVNQDLASSVTHAEAMKMFINLFKAENAESGYLTHAEYADILSN